MQIGVALVLRLHDPRPGDRPTIPTAVRDFDDRRPRACGLAGRRGVRLRSRPLTVNREPLYERARRAGCSAVRRAAVRARSRSLVRRAALPAEPWVDNRMHGEPLTVRWMGSSRHVSKRSDSRNRHSAP